MSARGRVVEVAHGVTLAAVVGAVVVDPSAHLRRAPDWPDWLRGHQQVDRVMSRLAPALFLSALASAASASVVAAYGRRGGLAGSRAAAAGCVAAAIAVTLTHNEPLNVRIRGWDPTDAPPDDWRAVRASWEVGHRRRRVLVAVAAACSAGGQLGSRRAVRLREGTRSD